MLRIFFSTVCMLGASFAKLAAQTLITNGSFEDGAGAATSSDTYVIVSAGSTAISGWTVVTDQIAWDNGTFPEFGFSSSTGHLFLDLTGDNDTAPHGGVQQTFSTLTGETYRVSFDLGTGTSTSGGPVSLQVTAGPTSQLFTNPSTTTNWTTYFLDFTANATTTTLTLQGVSTVGGIFIGLDSVTVTAIPEPATWATLGGLTVLGLAALRRRRI